MTDKADLSGASRYVPKDGRRPRQNPVHLEPTPRPAPKVRRDRDDAPAGYDKDVWHLALLFEQRALADKIVLHAGRPVLYTEIKDLVDRHGIRRQSFRQEVHGCTRHELPYYLAARCWYHYPPFQVAGHTACEITWVQMVEIIIAEFWSRIQNEYAIDQFRLNFAEYGRAAVKHWNNLRILKDIHEQRKPTGATMQAAGKEG